MGARGLDPSHQQSLWSVVCWLIPRARRDEVAIDCVLSVVWARGQHCERLSASGNDQYWCVGGNLWLVRHIADATVAAGRAA